MPNEPLRDGDNFEVASHFMVIELPCDLPDENLKQGAMLMVKKGAPIPDGDLGLIRLPDGMLALGRVFRLDADQIRLGRKPGYPYALRDIEIIGPVMPNAV